MSFLFFPKAIYPKVSKMPQNTANTIWSPLTWTISSLSIWYFQVTYCICSIMFHKWWWSLQPGLQPSTRKTYLHLTPCCFNAKQVHQQWDLIFSHSWVKKNNDSMVWGFTHEKESLQRYHAEAVNTLLCFSVSIC